MTNTWKPAEATNFDAGFVLDQMETDQQTFFLIGTVEGFAYQRFLKDKPDESGMSCIQNWLYGDTAKRWRQVQALFSKHREKPPAALIHALVKRECGE